MRDSWPRAFLRAIPIAVWLFALVVVAVAGAYNWNDWRTNVESYKADLDPRPRVDYRFPDVHEDVQERVTHAAEGLTWANRNYGGNLGICAAIGLALITVVVIYRRRVPRERRPSWRTWVLAVPLVVGLVALAVVGLGHAYSQRPHRVALRSE